LDTDKLEALRAKRLEVRARNLAAAQISLQSAGYKFSLRDETVLIEDTYAIEHPDDIAQMLVNAGAPPTRLSVEQENLEDYFLRLTNDSSLRAARRGAP
jgi:ABC-2 type transport system ATP-binding protein